MSQLETRGWTEPIVQVKQAKVRVDVCKYLISLTARVSNTVLCPVETAEWNIHAEQHKQ